MPQTAALLAAALAGLAASVGVGPPVAVDRLRPNPGHSPPVRWLAEWLGGEPTAPSARTRWSVGSAAAVAVAVLLDVTPVARLLAGAVVAVLVVGLLGRWEGAAARREREAVVLALPEALSLLAACLRGGLPVRRATQEVAEVVPVALARRLALVSASIRVGSDDATAWSRLADDPELGRMARDLARASTSGAALADSLSRLATEARAARAGLVESRARTTGVRSVLPLMVCFLPSFLLIGIVPIIGSMVLRMIAARG